MSRQTTIACDVCKKNIDESSGQFVDMGDYGAHAHISCFALLSAMSLVELLKLDSITFGPEKHVLAYESGKLRRLCYWVELQEDKEK